MPVHIGHLTAMALALAANNSAGPPPASVDKAANALADENLELDETLTTTAGSGLWHPPTTLLPAMTEFLGRADKVKTATDRQPLARDFGMSGSGLSATLSFLSVMSKHVYDRDWATKLHAAALRLPEQTGRAPISIAIAAGALDAVDGTCSPTDIDALLTGSTDRQRDLWLIATNCTNTSAMADILPRTEQSRPAMLWLVQNWTHSDPQTELAADDMYLSPEVNGHLQGEGHTQLIEAAIRAKLSQLYGMAMIKEGLAFADSLDPRVLAAALHPSGAGFHTSIDGFPLAVERSSEDWSTAIDHAAALALAGRRDDALLELDTVATPAERTKARACLDTDGRSCRDSNGRLTTDVLIVDQFLRNPSADPYVLLEERATGSSSSSALVEQILCRLVTGDQHKATCDDAEQTARDNRGGADGIQDEDRRLWAEIAKAFGPAFATARDRYASAIASYGVDSKPAVPRWQRASVDPEPTPFREAPLPAGARGKHPAATPMPKGAARLPQGFDLVRFERSGNRAVAVSLSPLLDPNGEVTQGGYWLHLSDDGGRHWHAPLYTGLAQFFPYVVPSSSRLPMLAGDHAHLEVEEALIDTASITYPPVGTRTRRKRSGIYLDIPFAALEADSDGDGLSDIAGHHLLLDGKGPDRPFVVGHDTDCAKPSSDTLAQLELLKTLYKVQARALIEPVNRSPSRPFGGWQSNRLPANPPIFLEGNPDDYRCLQVDRPMIVYRSSDRERLRRFSPDFQLISLPPITWNRAHDRGFLKWSMGWTGGTVRLEKAGDGWSLKQIGSWIT